MSLRGELMFDYGKFICEKRKEAGLTYNGLSERTGISDSSIQRMENGQIKTPKWENLCTIAQALEIHPFEIMKAAGYITEEDINPVHRLKRLDELDDDDIIHLQSYIDFLIYRKEMNCQRKGKV